MSRIAQFFASRWLRWVNFIATKETGECLALFRILSGISVIVAVGSPVVHDLVGALWIDAEYGGMRSLKPAWLLRLLGGATPAGTWTLIAITAAAGFTLAIGLFGRVSALVAGQGIMALSTLNEHARGSYDGLLMNSLWLLVLAPSTATLAVDCRRRTGRWTSDALVGAWPRYLIIVQLATLYFFTGLHKVSIHWTPAGGFSAVYYILQQPTWHYGDMTWIAHIYPVTQVATAVTWLFELSWPVVLLALYFRATADRGGRIRRLSNVLRLRTVYVVVGVSMHATIACVMEVGPFTWVTYAYYPCLFRPNELRELARRLWNRARVRPS